MANGMFAVQERLRRARGTRSRREIVDRAIEIEGAPDDLTEKHLRHLDTTGSMPPADGTALRAFAAALGVPWTELLTLLGYWPPLPADGGGEKNREAAIRDVCSRLGVRATQAPGGRIVIEL